MSDLSEDQLIAESRALHPNVSTGELRRLMQIPIPEELMRIPSGASIDEPDSVFSEDSGRFYHGYEEGRYFMPNDEAEQDRLDYQHKGFNGLLKGKLAWAPLTESPRHVLDIATGTGIWAIKFAQRHPQSIVIGTDLSAIQPRPNVPNCSFVKEDSEKPWVSACPFDYIHLRFVNTCFDDPKLVMKQAFEKLNPGGFVEFQDTAAKFHDMDGKLEGTALKRWSDLCIRGAAAMGRDIMVSQHYKEWLLEAGFVDVVEHELIWPCNTWPEDPTQKSVGSWQLKNFLAGVRGVGWKMLAGSGLSPTEIEQLIRDVKREAVDTSIRFYMPVWVVYGRKPFDGEVGKISTTE